MKRHACSLMPLGLLFAVSLVIAPRASAEVKYPVVEVKHLTKADSVDLSADYLNASYDDLREQLAKKSPFGKIVADGEKMADSDAESAVVLDCKIVEFKHGGLMPPYVVVDITLSNRTDHAVVKHFTSHKLPLNNGGRVPSDDVKAKNTGRFLAAELEHELK